MNKKPKPFVYIGYLGAVICALALLWGCAAVSAVKEQTRQVVKTISLKKSPYKKKVVVLPIQNETFITGSDIEKIFQKPFFEFLDHEYPHVFWIKPGEVIYPEQLLRLPRLISGQIDNLTLVRIGRELGLNAIVSVNLVNIDAEEKKTGILMFKGTDYFARVRIGFQVYDIGTGAKLLDDSTTHNLKVDGSEFDAIKTKTPDGVYGLNEVMTEIAEQGAEKVCNVIESHIWEGYVVSVEDNRMILSCGREHNLKTGDRFDLFNSQEIIEGKDGQKFFLPGVRVGEAEIISVAVGRSEALPVGSILVKPGFSIRPQ
jgi:hypothetical protein